nr:TIM barrel protein [Nocardia acididurans]
MLSAMAALGIAATEFGPPGYLPEDADELRTLLTAHGIAPVGGFLALPLHRDQTAVVDSARKTFERFRAAGAEVVVLAAATGLDGYDTRPELGDDEWRTLIDTVAALDRVGREYGLRVTVHPHVGTHIEAEAEVERFLADSDVPLCLDTGHLLIGGTDPVLLARKYADRIGHIHLKDVRRSLAEEVRGGRVDYSEAVRRGLYVPLGDGDVDIAALVGAVDAAGYRGWYVIEQDTALNPGDTADGPTGHAERSVRHLSEIGADIASARM